MVNRPHNIWFHLFHRKRKIIGLGNNFVVARNWGWSERETLKLYHEGTFRVRELKNTVYDCIHLSRFIEMSVNKS